MVKVRAGRTSGIYYGILLFIYYLCHVYFLQTICCSSEVKVILVNFNYADDNRLLGIGAIANTVMSNLRYSAEVMLTSFEESCM